MLKKHLKKIIALLWIALLVGAGYYFWSHGVTIESFQAMLKGLGWWGPFFYVIAYTVRPLVFFPTSIMTPAAAILFGPYWGWLLAYVGENFSARVAFFMARFLGQGLVEKKSNPLIKKYNNALTEKGFETVLFLRLVPLFPFDFVNYSCGLTKIRYSHYSLGTWIGVIPGLTAYIFLGSSLLEPLLLIPTIGLFIGLTLLANFLRKKRSPKK